MKSFYRQIAVNAASVPLVGGRSALRGSGVCQAPLRVVAAASPSTPTCQCGHARYASSRARASPTVRRAARQQTLRRRAPSEAQQQSPSPSPPPPQASTGGPMSGSIFPDDLSVLLPALEAATEMMGEVLTEAEFTHVVAAAAKIIEARRPVAEAELASEHNTTPYQLHMAAVLLLYGHKAVPDAVPSLLIALSLMHLATAAMRHAPGGYLPSTLTIVNMIAAQWPQSSATAAALRKTSIYRNAERQFLAYLNQQNSPADEGSPQQEDTAEALSLQADAFTLAGVLAEGVGEADRALQWYLAAREVGNADFGDTDGEEVAEEEKQLQEQQKDQDTEPRDVKWSWEQRCLEGIGRLHLAAMKQAAKKAAAVGESAPDITQTEHYRDAKAVLRTAALALGSGKAGLWLATDYAGDDDTSDDLDMMLYRAAVHAVPGTYDALARREATKASVLRGLHSSKVTEDAVFHQMMADEWQKLADVSKAASKDA